MRNTSPTLTCRATKTLLIAALLLIAVPSHGHHFGTLAQGGEPDDAPTAPAECSSGQCPYPTPAPQHQNAAQKNTTQNPTPSAGNPVDAFTGRKFLEIEDLVVPGVVPIRIVRQYNSQSRYDSPLGYGWTLTYDTRLFKREDGGITVRSWEGRKYRYEAPSGSGGFVSNAEPQRGGVPELEHFVPSRTEYTDTGVQHEIEFVMTYQSGEKAHFDTEGRLFALETPQGNRLRFSYSAAQAELTGMTPFAVNPEQPTTVGRYWQITDVEEQLRSQIGTSTTPEQFTGQAVALSYYSDGRLKDITSHDGRVVAYSYDELVPEPDDGSGPPGIRGNLAQVTGAHDSGAGETGIIETYRYPATPSMGASREDFEHIHNLTYYDDGPNTEVHYTTYIVATDEVDTQTYGQSSWDFTYDDSPPGPGEDPGRTTTIARTIRTPAEPDVVANTVYKFNVEGFLLEKTDALLNRIEYDRDPDDAGTLDGTEPLAKSQTRVYDEESGSETLIRTVNFEYDTMGRLEKTETSLAATSETVTTTQTFDSAPGYFVDVVATESTASLQQFITDFDYTVNSAGSPEITKIKQQKSAGVFVETDFTYHSDHGQLETITPPAVSPADHLKIKRLYNASGRLTEIQVISDDGVLPPTVDDHLKRKFTYDAAGNLQTVEDALGHITEFDWDGQGRLIRRTEQIGGTGNESDWESTLFRYGAPNEITDVDTNPGEFLLQVEIGALGDPSGTLTAGHVQRFVRDSRGRIKKIEQQVGAGFVEISSHIYDSDDNRIESSEPTDGGASRTLEFTYDAMGQLLTVTDDANNTTTFAYDPLGNRTKVTDDNSQITDFSYDELDRLVKVIQQGEGLTTEFSYDAVGNVTHVKDPKLQETIYAYDDLSRLDTVTQELNQVVDYDYDNRGRLTRVENARGQALLYDYFLWGGLDELDYDDNDDGTPERTVSYTYDFNGNVKTTTDGGTLLWTLTYDALNRVDLATANYIPNDPQLDSDYDSFGNRVKLTLLDGHGTSPSVQSWGFDERERLVNSCMPEDAPCTPGSETLIFGYFDNEDLKAITRASSVVTDLTYHPEGPVDTITVTGAQQLHKLDYAIDSVLNVDTVSEWVGANELERTGSVTPAYDYGYDDAYRLNDAKYPVAYGLPTDDIYAYDDAGNRDDGSAPGTPIGNYVYDANNRIEDDSTRQWAHDADGNICRTSPNAIVRTGDPCADPVLTGEVIYSYDATNRLRSISSPGSGTVAHSYDYDPFGRRIEKATGGSSSFYLWDGDQLVAEYDDMGDREVRYAYAGGFAPAQVAYDDGGGGEDVYDVHADHLDTPRMLTDDTGAPVWRTGYGAFGTAYLDTGNTLAEAFNIRFPGQYYDAEIGLHYNRYRYYDPSIGRYVSADPLGQLAQPNVFAYVGSNPVNGIDPLGLLDPYTGSGQAVIQATSAALDQMDQVASAAQAALSTLACAGGTALPHVLAGGFGGFLGDISTGASISIAGVLTFAGTGAVATSLPAAAAATTSTGSAFALAAGSAGAVSVAAVVGAYTTALGATTLANSINTAFGTNLATFSNTGPLQTFFPDLTGSPLPFSGSTPPTGACGCQ